MRCACYVLSLFCRPVEDGDLLNESYEHQNQDVDYCADTLKQTFPNMNVSGKKVLDVGCANGTETRAIKKMGAAYVHGIDIRTTPKETSEYKIHRMDVTDMSFADDSFDAVLSCGSFEHFLDPEKMLQECDRVLRPGGKIYLTSGVWSHPWGAHMNFFCRLPWVQFFFSEKTIMKVRAKYRNDGAKRFCEVEGGLNKVGIKRLIGMVETMGMEFKQLRLRPVLGLEFLTRIPIVREFFTNLIICVLCKPSYRL